MPRRSDAGVERGQRAVVALVGIPQLRDEEDVVAGHSGLGERPAGLGLVAVDGGGVDMAVARVQRGRHRAFGVLRRGLQNAESDLRDRITVVQRDRGRQP